MEHLDLGFKGFFYSALEGDSPEKTYRISADYGMKYRALGIENGEVKEYQVRAQGLSDSGEKPVTGDWFTGKRAGGSDEVILERLLERESEFARSRSDGRKQVMAANLSHIFITTSMNEEFNLSRLERYLVLAKASGVTPTIILNKCDLPGDPSRYIRMINRTDNSLYTVAVSTVSGTGLDELRSLIQRGDTCVFLGSSGVGKSSLVNHLMGTKVLDTLDISSKGARGSHTTTNRFMFLLPGGGLVIDSPGLREVGIGANEDSVDETFSDITGLIGKCRFRNCSHQNEAGCAILESLEDGSLDSRRYQSWLKLKKESIYSQDPDAFRRLRHQEWRKITKTRRGKLKLEKKLGGG